MIYTPENFLKKTLLYHEDQFAQENMQKECFLLHSVSFDTKLGTMFAVADTQMVYMLEFLDNPKLTARLERLKRKMGAMVLPGSTPLLEDVQKQLDLYYDGRLFTFEIPYFSMGTPFEKLVWQQLHKIPYGQTQSYKNVAQAVGNPLGFRAVARANSINQLAIIIPCHRVINSSGAIGGYAGGIERKRKLLNLEKQSVCKQES